MKVRRIQLISCYVLLLIFFLVAVTPFIWTILNSLKTNDEIFTRPFSLPADPEWGNFLIAWRRGNLGVYFKNSVLVLIPTVIGIVFSGCLAGYAFARLRSGLINFLFYVFLFGLTIPIQAIIIPLYYDLHSLGLVDNLGGVIAPAIGISMPLSIFIMRIFFGEIPQELADAAIIDGCSGVGIFWYVMLPLSKPALSTLVVIFSLFSWNDYFLPLIVLISDANRTLPLGIVRFQGTFSALYNLTFSTIVISSIPIIVIFIIFQKQFIKGIAGGAVKG